jgi:hypothetical protein
MSVAVPFDLLSIATRSSENVWIGQFAPLDWVGLNLDHGTNFRASSTHHQRYDAVWFFEDWFHDGNLHRMELQLDEMIRLLKGEGFLILRYQFELVASIKHFLARRPGCSVEVEREWRQNSEIVSVFRIRRRDLELYRDTRWTFAVLTTGKKEAEVVKFIRSIREQPEGASQEVIVCGPRADSYDAYGVTYLEKSYRPDLAEISKKKNDLAEMARHPNLLVCHDRYLLNPDFFAGFERFGYDFDFVTIRQWLDTGEDYPTYCALERDLIVSPTRMLHSYDALYTGHFINGGLFAIKTHTLRALPLNSIIFWEQAEDVEFTKTLRSHSLPPRINILSSSETCLEGPRGADTRRIYRIGQPPAPSEVVEPPPAQNPQVPSPPMMGPLSKIGHRGLAPLMGQARAARIIVALRQRKKLVAALGVLLLFHIVSVVLLLLIAIRVFR